MERERRERSWWFDGRRQTESLQVRASGMSEEREEAPVLSSVS